MNPALPSIESVVGTECFTGTERQPRQVVRVRFDRPLAGRTEVVVDGGARGRAVAGRGAEQVEISLAVPDGTAPGTELPLSVRAVAEAGGTAEAAGTLTVAEPGWTMYLVSHFHYDPVWWNTQAGYTATWELQGNDGTTRPVWERNGFNLVRAHLATARQDPDYTFVLAEVDYLKPFWDLHPEHRDELRQLVADGRVEIMGGTYNEPNTNLTGLETTVRNLVHGVGYQRDVLGADPQTAWQLDVFGHDPQFPGLVADAGLSSSSWARGPFHQWGPILSRFRQVGGDARNMQFPAEFEWLSPSGKGVLTHYMPNHYSAGWWMDSSATLEEAEQRVYELYQALKPAAATRNLLLPVGTDYTPPNKWVTGIHRDWNARYLWPRFVCGLPRDFFAAVRAELDARGVRPSPQTRDMNPVYTGKDVSYIDTKQAQRAAETAATDAEKLAALAEQLGLGRYPHAALDKVWRQLAFGAHHDAITGSESDQVYVDLLTGWREAHDLAADVRERALDALTERIDTADVDGIPLVVTNTLAFRRTDLARVRVELPPDWPGPRLLDPAGAEVPLLVEARQGSSWSLAFVARDVPSLGWRTWRLVPASDTATPGWQPVPGATAANSAYRVTADPERGGALSGIREQRTGRELLRAGSVGNELRLYDEYPAHPEFGEGPWHLVPSGPVVSSADAAAESVRAETCPAGERLVVTGSVGGLRYEQRITLWHGLDRVDLRTRVLDYRGADKLLRVRFGADIPGARPVSEVAGAVVGRGFGIVDVDSAEAPWTLDNPANTFFALSSTARLRLAAPDGAELGRLALSVAEVVVPALDRAADDARELVRALARVGVTATTATAEGARYGWLQVDSNLPDLRIVLGGPDRNPLARALLASAGPDCLDELERQLHAEGAARLLVPGKSPVEEAWTANADLRAPGALPTLIVAAVDEDRLQREVALLAQQFAAGAEADARLVPGVGTDRLTLLDPHTLGLLNTGMPGFAVDTSGGLHLSLMRSCTGWPSGVWLDPPRRTSPDGSGFQLQHWTHDFDYALVSGPGDWRTTGLVAEGHARSTPLLARTVDVHPGPLPSTHSLLSVEPERAVQLTAVKATGNPHAHGLSAATDGGAAGLTVRLVETTGLGATATVTPRAGETTGAVPTDLLEQRPLGPRLEGPALTLDLPGASVTTLVTTTGLGARQAVPLLGPSAERAQPVYSRYWLHNRGPAPLGFLPVGVAVTPTVRCCAQGGGVSTEVVLASHLVAEDFDGLMEVQAPAGWSVEPAVRPVSLGPGGHTRFPLDVTLPEDAAPGLYFVRVQLPVGDNLVEDVLSVVVPGSTLDDVVPPPAGPELAQGDQTKGTHADHGRPTGLTADWLSPDGVALTAGTSARLRLHLRNSAASPIDGEATAVSPWGTWHALTPGSTGFHVPAGSRTELAFDVSAPADAEPGEWWALVKLMWFGRVQYTAAVPLRVVSP